jgi:DNA-directed RNA polymerase specialized sigma24 family protein
LIAGEWTSANQQGAAMNPAIDDEPKLPVEFALPFRAQLFAHARRLTGNEPDANDLVQDTFERALRAARRRSARTSSGRG